MEPAFHARWAWIPAGKIPSVPDSEWDIEVYRRCLENLRGVRWGSRLPGFLPEQSSLRVRCRPGMHVPKRRKQDPLVRVLGNLRPDGCTARGQRARTDDGRGSPHPPALRGKAALAVTVPGGICLSAVLGGVLVAWQERDRSTSTGMSLTAETFLRD